MPVNLGYKCRRQKRRRCSPHGQYQIIANTRSVLLWNYASQLCFVMPDMHAGQLHNLVTGVQKAQAEVLFFTAIACWR